LLPLDMFYLVVRPLACVNNPSRRVASGKIIYQNLIETHLSESFASMK